MIAVKINLIALPTIIVYKGYESLPYRIESELSPTEKIPFDFIFDNGAISELRNK